MRIIDPHIHMVSRITDDYMRLATSGVVAVSEPAFWAGFDRGSVDGFRDYFRQLTEMEPARASQYGIQHYCWLCINAKEAENVELSREVIAMIPEFLDKPNVLGIGEIGLNKNTKNEMTIFEEHVEFALDNNQLILIHTPHLQDKLKGTTMIVDSLLSNKRVDPSRVLIDHVEEHTIKRVLDHGFWCGMTLYPVTKCSPERCVDMIEMYGGERVCVNSACDWGPSDPTNPLKAIFALRRRKHAEELIEQVFYNNPCHFFGQNPKFKLKPSSAASFRESTDVRAWKKSSGAQFDFAFSRGTFQIAAQRAVCEKIKLDDRYV